MINNSEICTIQNLKWVLEKLNSRWNNNQLEHIWNDTGFYTFLPYLNNNWISQAHGTSKPIQSFTTYSRTHSQSYRYNCKPRKKKPPTFRKSFNFFQINSIKITEKDKAKEQKRKEPRWIKSDQSLPQQRINESLQIWATEREH